MNKLIVSLIGYILLGIIVIGAAVLLSMRSIGYFDYLKIKTIVSAPAYQDGDPITIMSSNARRREKLLSTSKLDTGDRRWYRRAKYYLANIELVEPDILGCQEVQPGQYKFLCKHLKGYGSVVCYRDKKGSRSESCPIFYNKNRFTLLDSGTFWLSETPDKMSLGWDCTQYRICTFAKLQDKNGEILTVFNTHPDWSHDEARIKQLQVVADRVKQTEGKCVVIGDLNSAKGTDWGDRSLASLEAILKDSQDFNGGVYYGDTYNGYGSKDEDEMPLPLDYIYLPESATVYEVGKIDKVYNGVYPSDHFPIYAKVSF